MEASNFRYYEFGEFRLDARRRILLQNGNQIPLSAKIFDLLLVMVQNEGRVLEHDELLDKVWEGMFVEQSNVKKSISALRQVLGERPAESLYIKTVPRRGYSFVAPVRALPDDATAEETAFYRETETEVFIEEIIEDESEPEAIYPKALPPAAAEPKSSSAKFERYKIPVAVAALLLIAGAVFFAVRGFSSKPTLNYSVENVRAKRLTSEGNLGNSAPISPDGNFIAYPVYFGEQGSLWLKQVETGSVARLTPMMAAQFWAYEFSPDGNYVYYIINHTGDPAQSGLYRIPTLGGAPQKLSERANAGLAFAPDGSRFSFTRRTDDKTKIEVVTAKMDGSDLRRSFVIPENNHLWSLKWSPDNLNLLYAMRERSDGKALGYVAETPWNNDSDTATENIILPKQENQIVTNAAWLPDKTAMLLSVREPNADICQIWQYSPSTGEKSRVTNDDNSYRIVSLTADGKSLSTVQESWKSEAWTADTSNSANGINLDFRPIAGIKNLGVVRWTKDDKLIYEAVEDQQAAIFLSDAAGGGGKRRLTRDGDGIYLFPNFSQDGNYITFLSNRSGSSQVWRMDSDGANAQRLTDSPTTVGWYAKLLSDGQTLLFMTHTHQTGWILQKQTPDGKITPLTKGDTGHWSVSPDEKLLVAEVRDEETKKFRIYVQSLDDNGVLKIFDFAAARQISWTRDGKALIYIAPKQDADELVLQPLDETPAKIISSTRGERIHGFDWSFDGSKLVIIRSQHVSDAFLIKAQQN